ncbi:MAG: FAD-dependent oxidoreductase, partial [Phycisphaerales bacterium]|nr:FAD-dependent oxidoreductase [Phycisphaerales bacterium]
FESDETVFFVWVARQWHAELGSQLPYRMILPKGLENLLIACRSAGVTVEAHPMLRQQRDIQRLGEVAGCAAALAIKHNCSSRGVPYAELRRILEASGALSIDRSPVESFTWEKVPGAYFEQAAMTLDEALAEMQSGSGMGLYQLYLNPEFARTRVAELLGHAASAVTFRAAALLAMWGDSAAERRLLEAVETREYGFDDAPADRRPEVDPRVVPHHMVALTLLRQCCTIDSLAVFERLSGNPELPHNARTAIALNLEAFAHRQIPAKAGAMWEQFQRILANLLATPAPQTIRNPKRWPDPPTSLAPTDRAPVLEDFSWQIHLSVAKAELAVGLPVHRAAAAFLQDPRALVRKAFYSLTASTSSRTIFR